MKVTVSKYLNARTGKPSVHSACPFYLAPGFVLEIDDVLIGDEIDGNSIWYHAKEDGCYYWSGGIGEVEFEVVKTYTSEDRLKILKNLINNYSTYYRSKYRNLTGIFIGKKTTNKEEIEGDCLVFQVSNKKVDIKTSALIPKKILFKGILIETDVVEASIADYEWSYPGFDEPRKPGGNLSRFKNLDAGTISFKAQSISSPTKYFVLTNYHVVAKDLIKRNVFSIDVSSPSSYEIMMPAYDSDQSGQVMGHFIKGLFNTFQDTALIQLTNKDDFTNRLSDGTVIAEQLDVFNQKQFENQNIVMYGAMSGIVRTGRITSVNAAKSFSVKSIGVINSMIELIQLSKISAPGDSGSPILLGNKLIGILIGSDDSNSYAIPIDIILNYYKVQISKS